jgi:uncharacterized membrane protein
MKEEVLEDRIELALKAGLALSTTLLVVGLASGAPGLLRSGLLLLMLTPVCRVFVVTTVMALHRDWVFALISLFVLAVLLSGLVVAVRLW